VLGSRYEDVIGFGVIHYVAICGIYMVSFQSIHACCKCVTLPHRPEARKTGSGPRYRQDCSGYQHGVISMVYFPRYP